MHIPDGYLSPESSLTLWTVMLPIWATAGAKLKRGLKVREVPLLAIGAAFSFVIMMFNVPIPDGTTAHAVGGALIAIVLGPWAAVIGLTVALAIQALLFGDGGLWALGANAFNMAFLLPFTGYGVYRLVSAGGQRRRILAAGLGGYVGINVSALATAVEFGLQPLLFHAADGTPLYGPYRLSQTIPALMAAHLTVAGLVEGLVTALAVGYLWSAGVLPEQAGLVANDATVDSLDRVGGRRGPNWPRRLWTALGLLALLTPLGLLARGAAWGEWGPTELKARLGYVPRQLAKTFASAWAQPFSGYQVPQLAGKSAAAGYAGAALIGLAVVGGVAWLFGWWLGRGRRDFVAHTLRDVASAARQAFFASELAERPGFLQALDARAKLGATLVLTGTILFVRQPVLLLAILLGLGALGFASRLPVGALARRILLVVCLFSGLAVLPSLFNWVLPGTPWLVVAHFTTPLRLFGHVFPAALAITRQGVRSAAVLLLRALVSLWLVTLLTASTTWPELLRGLRVLLVPRAFVLVLEMAHRYIFLLLGLIEETFVARESRTVGRTKLSEQQAFVGRSVGNLFLRSQALGEEVYQAMLARGYTGEPHTLGRGRMRPHDWAVVMVAAALAALLIWGDIRLGRIG